MQSYRGLASACWRGLILSLIESTLVGTFYFLSIYFVRDLHFSVAIAGMIVSVYGFGAIAGGYLGGKLSDETSPVAVMCVSLFVQAICYLFLTELTSISKLLVDIVLLGMAGYAFITANHLWVLGQCRSGAERLKALNMFSTFSNLGLSISGILIGITAEYGFKNIFLVTGLFLAALATYLLLIGKIKSHIVHPAQQNISGEQIERENIKPNNLTMMMVLFSVIFIGSIVSQLGAGYAIYINEVFHRMGMSAVSVLFTLNSALVVILATPIGQFINQFNKLTMLGISSFLIGFGMFMLSFTSIFSMAILACVVYTIGEIIYFGLVQLVCYETGEAKSKGSSLGRYRVVYGASRVVGPVVGGAIYSHYSGQMLWYACGVVGVFCMVGFFYVRCVADEKLTIQSNKILV